MFGAILGGLSIASSVLGYSASRKARKRGKRAEALSASRAAIINVQHRRAAAASLRRQKAIQAAAAMANGMRGGSGDHATAGSIESQGTAEVAKQRHQLELGAGINEQLAAANKYRNRAADFNAAAQLLGQGASFANALAPAPTPTAPTLPSPPV